MQALLRHVVAVIAAFAHLLRPADEGRVQALTDFLRLLVEQLLRHLLPGEAQIARHRDQAQTHGTPRREIQRSGIAVIVPLRQKVDGFVRR